MTIHDLPAVNATLITVAAYLSPAGAAELGARAPHAPPAPNPSTRAL